MIFARLLILLMQTFLFLNFSTMVSTINHWISSKIILNFKLWRLEITHDQIAHQSCWVFLKDLFINDLAYYITSIIIKLFADYTSFIISGFDISVCIVQFKPVVIELVNWSNNNKLDINWTKTYAFVNSKKEIELDQIQVNNLNYLVWRFTKISISINMLVQFL